MATVGLVVVTVGLAVAAVGLAVAAVGLVVATVGRNICVTGPILAVLDLTGGETVEEEAEGCSVVDGLVHLSREGTCRVNGPHRLACCLTGCDEVEGMDGFLTEDTIWLGSRYCTADGMAELVVDCRAVLDSVCTVLDITGICTVVDCTGLRGELQLFCDPV